MTIGKNGNGNYVIYLTDMESKAFAEGHPIIKTTPMRSGIVETEVKNRVTCPNVTTRAFLRDLSQRYENTYRKPCPYDVEEALTMLRSDQGLIEADLRKFIGLVSGDVPIVEMMRG